MPSTYFLFVSPNPIDCMAKMILELIFWALFLLVVYTYAGYGLVVWLLVKIRKVAGKERRVVDDTAFQPDVTLVVPAYNEQDYIAHKLQNSIDLDYPTEHIRFLFVTEGSTDGTSEFIEQMQQQDSRISLTAGRERKGKIEAMNLVMPFINTPITIFTDANTTLNPEAIRCIVRHFADPQVGAVAGEKRIITLANESAAGSGEGFYWKYESFLKKLDTQLYSVVGAAGELFAIRTELYKPVEKDTLLDDFMISLRIAEKGYRVIYEPEAYAIERPSFSIDDEQKRKVRIAAGGFQSISRLGELLNIFRYGWLSFQYISHRVLRWAVTPFCLPLMLFINALLVLMTESDRWSFRLYVSLLIAQIAFYLFAFLGHILASRQLKVKIFFIPYYFTFMNWCAILGYVRFRTGSSTGIWEKARRAA